MKLFLKGSVEFTSCLERKIYISGTLFGGGGYFFLCRVKNINSLSSRQFIYIQIRLHGFAIQYTLVCNNAHALALRDSVYLFKLLLQVRGCIIQCSSASTTHRSSTEIRHSCRHFSNNWYVNKMQKQVSYSKYHPDVRV